MRGLDWLRIALVAAATAVLMANLLFLAGYALWVVAHAGGPFDYPIFAEASTRLFDGTLYQWDTHGYIYPYSPVFAWVFVPFAYLGLWIWQGLHFLMLLLIPSWPARLLVLVSVPFWMDAWEGNVGIFFLVAGYWAVRGNRIGTFVFMALCLMIPKPIYLPVLVWMLWREPRNRLPFVYLLVGHSILALATGYAFDWLAALPGASHDMATVFNFMPSRIIGWWWWPIGLAISAWLVYRDHPGWASVTSALYGAFHIMWAPLFEPPELIRRLVDRMVHGRA